LYLVHDRLGVSVHDALGATSDCRDVSVVGCAGRDGCRCAEVREQDANGDGFWREAAGADLVEWFGHRAMEGLAGEAGEVDRDVRALERGFDVWAEADGLLGAGANEGAGSLARDDQPFVAEDAQRGLDGFAGDAVAVGVGEGGNR
jgi:hypothetical protein